MQKKPTNGDVDKTVQELSEEDTDEILQMPEVQRAINGNRTLKA